MTDQLFAQKVIIVGVGTTGKSVARFLISRQVDIEFWQTEGTEKDSNVNGVKVNVGESPAIDWSQVSAIIVSPGVDPESRCFEPAKKQNVPIYVDVELYARVLSTQETKPKLIGITGSNGKTTATLLVESILRTAGIRAVAAGNIGLPVLDTLDNDFDVIVIELSSFQLQTISSLHLDVACWLNLSEDHLDRHGDMDAYAKAKARIYDNAKVAIHWKDQKVTAPTSKHVQTVTFSTAPKAEANWTLDENLCICEQGSALFDTTKSSLVGLHNVQNIQAACAVAKQLGVSNRDIEYALEHFDAPPHRCVRVSNAKGIDWIDDSKATNPGATLAALKGIGEVYPNHLILIAGGDSKGADLSILKQAFEQYLKKLIVLGKDATKLAALYPSASRAKSMGHAVNIAFENAEADDAVLLSPACASIDMFENYIDRARQFEQAIVKGAAHG